MRNKICAVLFLLFFTVYLLFHPLLTLTAASRGLLLWFYTLLPTLLPYLILTTLVNSLLSSSKSSQSLFILFMGLFCGFPVGSRLCAQSLQAKRITQNEAQYLMGISNMASPAFLITYILNGTLKVTGSPVPYLVCLYLPVLLTGILTYPVYHSRKASFENIPVTDNTISEKPVLLSMELFDNTILKSFEIITKLGGYMILFSILGSMLVTIPFISRNLISAFMVLFEITMGAQYLADSSFSSFFKLFLTLSGVNFGGLSFLLQTASMILGTRLRIMPYLITKAIIATMTAFLVFLLFI